MAEYINRNELVKNLDRFAPEHLTPLIRQLIEKQPTADVEEVKHGEWIEKEDVYGDIYYTCSVCNNDWTTIDGTPQENFMKRCPCCGAKMDGVNYEPGKE